MAGDIEDFLKRAAQRRQVKAAEQARRPEPPQPSRPRYSNIRSERVVIPVEDADEILTAELIEDDTDSISNRMKRLAEAKRVAAAGAEEAGDRMRESRGMLSRSKIVKKQFTGNPVQDLLSTLNHPGGLQQAILLREILDRPEHRW